MNLETPSNGERPSADGGRPGGGLRSTIKSIVERAIRFHIVAQAGVNAELHARLASLLTEVTKQQALNESLREQLVEAKRVQAEEHERTRRHVSSALVDLTGTVEAVSRLGMGLAEVARDGSNMRAHLADLTLRTSRNERAISRLAAFRAAVRDQRRLLTDMRASLDALAARVTALQRQGDSEHDALRTVRIRLRGAEVALRDVALSFGDVEQMLSLPARASQGSADGAPHAFLQRVGDDDGAWDTIEHDAPGSQGPVGPSRLAEILQHLATRCQHLQISLENVFTRTEELIAERFHSIEANVAENRVAADVLIAERFGAIDDQLARYRLEVDGMIAERIGSVQRDMESHRSQTDQLITERFSSSGGGGSERMEFLERYAKDIASDAARALEGVERLRYRIGAVPFTNESPTAFEVHRRSTAEAFDYVGFEQVFRGSEELIRERQRAYADFFRGQRHVLDLGCGRGEFLEVMREIGIDASGVDMNAGMVERCRSKGFANVWEADAVGWLAETDAVGFDGIFSAQFVEHIQFDDLVRLVAHSHRLLFPRGVFVAETVNPLSIDGFKTFFVDPSHVRPLFPEVLGFLCRSVGFSEVRIFYPNGGGFTEPDPTTQNEYAVVAYK